MVLYGACSKGHERTLCQGGCSHFWRAEDDRGPGTLRSIPDSRKQCVLAGILSFPRRLDLFWSSSAPSFPVPFSLPTCLWSPHLLLPHLSPHPARPCTHLNFSLFHTYCHVSLYSSPISTFLSPANCPPSTPLPQVSGHSAISLFSPLLFPDSQLQVSLSNQVLPQSWLFVPVPLPGPVLLPPHA